VDYSEIRPVGELIGISDNADVTLEELRAILAEEMTVEDIYRRRRMAEYEARFAADVEAARPKFEAMQTRHLLRKFRKEQSFRYRNGDWYFGEPADTMGRQHQEDVDSAAMKKVLDTREHCITRNKAEGKAARRAAAQRHHGDKRLRRAA